MRRSKLLLYIDILKALAYRGPLKLTYLMYRVNISCSVIKSYLDFLIKQNLVEERVVGNRRSVYAITERGRNVLKCFRELKEILPIEEQARIEPPLY